MTSDALNSTWYYPKMTRADAEACLEPCPTGAFVVRPSSQSESLALSHKNHDGSVGHALIYSATNGFVLERTNRVLPSVLAVLQTLPLRFDLPVQTPPHLLSAAAINQRQAAPVPPVVILSAGQTTAAVAMPSSAPLNVVNSAEVNVPDLVSSASDDVDSAANGPRRDDADPSTEDAAGNDMPTRRPSKLSQASAAVSDGDEGGVDGNDVDGDGTGDDEIDDDGDDDAEGSTGDEAEMCASPPTAQRSTMRSSFIAARGGSKTDNKVDSLATLRSSRNAAAPIDEQYVLRLLSVPDIVNPSLMTAEENRLFDRLVIQLQLQLKS